MPNPENVNEAILEAIFTSAQDGIFVINEAGYYTNVNPYACELVGYTYDELCQMHVNDLRFPQDIIHSQKRLANLFKDNGTYIPELLLRHKNGSEIWVSMSVTPMSLGSQNFLVGITRNITQQKETEQALRESESRYRTLFEQATDSILILDTDTLQIIDSNEQAYLHLGFARDEVIQHSIFDLVGDSKKQIQDHLAEASAQGFATHEITLRMKNGKLCHVLMSTRTVLLNKKTSLFMMWRDITQMKQIEDSLYFTSQQGWKENDDNFLDALVIHLTEKLNVDYAFIGELVDTTHEKVRSVATAHRGQPIQNMEYDLAATPCEDVIDNKLCYYISDVQTLFPEDKELQDLDIEGYMGIPLWRSNGQPLGIIVILNTKPLFNIELAEAVLRVVAVRAAHELEQQQAKQALEHSEARYASVIRSMAEGIVVHQPDGKIIDANIQAERILGLTYEQIIGRDSIDLRWHTIHEDGSPFRGEMHPAVITLETGEPQHNVIMGVYKPDGELSWISINSEPLTLENGQQKGVVVSFNEITELRTAQEKEKQAELMQIEFEKQEELNGLRSRVISMISHEFRTPMTIIMTSTSLLRMKADVLNKEELLKRLQKIDKQVTILNNMVDEVTAVNKSSYGSYQLQLTQLNIKEFYANILSEIDIVFEQHAPIKLDLATKSGFYLFDENLLHQIVWNIISNAVKYTPADGKIDIQCQIDKTNFKLNVKDNGIGIPLKSQTYLYDAFYRGDNVGTVSGTGLGLSIAHQAVKILGGTITFTSEVDTGTEFIVQFPLI